MKFRAKLTLFVRKRRKITLMHLHYNYIALFQYYAQTEFFLARRCGLFKIHLTTLMTTIGHSY